MNTTARIFTTDFTRSFLDELFSYLDKQYLSKGKSLERTAIVFGGKRPALFLKRRLAVHLRKAFVPPVFFTIDEFMDYAADKGGKLVPGRELDRAFTLFHLAKKVAPGLLDGRQDFARFLPWAREILDFIEQLDLEDVENSKLLNVEAAAAIGYPVPESINELLRHINKLRAAMHAEQRRQGRTFRGLQYLCAAQEVGRHSWDEFDEIIFCNLFYFHRTEENVVRRLHEIGKATLIFQGDQTKWPVLERIARHFHCELKEGSTPTPTAFKRHYHAAFDVHSQAAVVRDVLAGIKDLDRTVVVLPNAGTLVPLLSALPDDLKDVNVSIGYDLGRSSLAQLLEFIFKAQLSRKSGRYYTQDYLRVIRHPFLKNIRLSDDDNTSRVLIHKVEEVLTGRIKCSVSGSSFIAPDEIEAEDAVVASAKEILSGMGVQSSKGELKDALVAIHRLAFLDWEGITDLLGFAAALGRFLDMVSAKSPLRNYPLNVNFAARMYEITEEFAEATFGQEAFPFADIVRMFEDKLSREVVNFSGTPLKGLQVLGLFETRSLNFDNVIIMDANEGILPRLEVRSTLIPREVMTQLGLDRLELEEEIQRYQFMRIISSAQQVHLVYQDRKDKEKSRFIEELVWEDALRAGKNLAPAVEHVSFAVKVAPTVRSASKTAHMLEQLRVKRYSASALNAYLKNPYGFYMDHVLGLREAEDLLDEPEGRQIGIFIHELLKEVYLPLVGKKFIIDDAFEARARKLCDERFAAGLARSMRSEAFLVKAVVDHRLKVFFENERERAAEVEELLGVEWPLEGEMPLSIGMVRFRCVVDRVERRRDGSIAIMDYKTGGGEQCPKKSFPLSDEMSREVLFKDLRSFQLPLYFYFVSQKYPQARLLTEIHNLREAKVDPFPETAVAAPHTDFLSPFIKAVDCVVSEILDPAQPFLDDDLKNYD